MRVNEMYSVWVNPIRRRILYALSHRDLCVGELQRVLGLSQVAVSKQLQVLRAAKTVTVVKEGNRRCYRLANESAGLTEQVNWLRRFGADDSELLSDTQRLGKIEPRENMPVPVAPPEIEEFSALESHLL